MSELISGKEALKAISDGEVVEIWFNSTDGWHEIKTKYAYSFDLFLDQKQIRFRLKPRTITINDSDVPCCYSIGINRVKGKIEIDFKNTEDADIAYRVLKDAFGF